MKDVKKTYEKPRIIFEDMKFDTAIAKSCDWVEVEGGGGISMADLPGFVYFNLSEGSPICNMDAESTDAIYCYHNPDGFASSLLANMS